MSSSLVREIASLVGWNRAGTADIDWAPTEESLGLRIPESFKEIAEVFGPGEFSQYLFVSGPGDEHVSESLVREVALWSEPTISADLMRPYLPRPADGGLVAWGRTCQADTFFWLPSSEDPDSWPILALEEDFAGWHRFDMTVPEFILEVIGPGGGVHPFSVGDIVPPSFLPLDR
ncbi:hypothetical protein [Kitasatospora sp. P5_F3]